MNNLAIKNSDGHKIVTNGKSVWGVGEPNARARPSLANFHNGRGANGTKDARDQVTAAVLAAYPNGARAIAAAMNKIGHGDWSVDATQETNPVDKKAVKEATAEDLLKLAPNADMFSVTGKLATDLEEYSIDPNKVLEIYNGMLSGRPLYATNPPVAAAADADGNAMVYIDNELDDQIPLINVIVTVLAENGGDFDPTMSPEEFDELGANLDTDDAAYAAVKQFLMTREENDDTGLPMEHTRAVAEGKEHFDYFYHSQIGAEMITYKNGEMDASLGFWDEEEPIQVNWMDKDGDVIDTWNYSAADIGPAVAKFVELIGEKVPLEMLKQASAKMLSGEYAHGTSSKSEGKPAPGTTVSPSTARKEGTQMKTDKRTYRAIKEAKVPSLLRAHRGLKTVREDEMDGEEFFVAIAPEGADAAAVEFDGDTMFIGPFASVDAAIAAVGADDGEVDVVDAECNPVSADGAGDSDDIVGMADDDLPMEARKLNAKKIRERVMKRILDEATALDVDTTVGSGTEVTDNGSGEHADNGAPPVSQQSPQDAGGSTELDVDTDVTVGKPVVAIAKPEDGAMDDGEDQDLSGAGDGKSSVSMSESRFGLKRNQLVLVIERATGKKCDRGLIEKITDTGVVLAGDEAYDHQSYEIKKIA